MKNINNIYLAHRFRVSHIFFSWLARIISLDRDFADGTTFSIAHGQRLRIENVATVARVMQHIRYENDELWQSAHTVDVNIFSEIKQMCNLILRDRFFVVCACVCVCVCGTEKHRNTIFAPLFERTSVIRIPKFSMPQREREECHSFEPGANHYTSAK